MEAEFWQSKWREGRIAFHEGKPNGFLVRHIDILGAKKRVLVPLCGKSEDMALLASEGHDVVGVELAESAALAFFKEHGLSARRTQKGAFIELAAARVTILVGDFFALTQADIGAVNAFYDRAALIALPEEMRARYTQKLTELLPKGIEGIVIVVDYPQSEMQGPPFAISTDALSTYYPHATIDLLAEKPADVENLRQTSGAFERCYLIAL